MLRKLLFGIEDKKPQIDSYQLAEQQRLELVAKEQKKAEEQEVAKQRYQAELDQKIQQILPALFGLGNASGMKYYWNQGTNTAGQRFVQLWTDWFLPTDYSRGGRIGERNWRYRIVVIIKHTNLVLYTSERSDVGSVDTWSNGEEGVICTMMDFGSIMLKLWSQNYFMTID